MLSVEERLLIEERVAEFATAVVESTNAGDVSATTENLLVFYEFLCRVFVAAKREGRTNAVSDSYSNN